MQETELPEDPFVERLTDVFIQQRLQEIHLQLETLARAASQAGASPAAINLELAPIAASKFRDLPENTLNYLQQNVLHAFDAASLKLAAGLAPVEIVMAAARDPHLYADTAIRASLVAELQNQPHLQAKVSALTYYSPSKWLLEQEMLSRVRPGVPVPPGPAPSTWPPDRPDVYDFAEEESLIGLCFSGGGVRSATFNLGILQALAELNLLKHFDYLSSVSGGGYIHQWFAAYIKRSSDMEHVRKELISQPQDKCMPATAEPIRWLRRYASYLTPNRALFSADLWVVVAIWFRNTLLNQIVLFTILGMLFAFPHILIGNFDAVTFATPPLHLHLTPQSGTFDVLHHGAALLRSAVGALPDIPGQYALQAGNLVACLLFLWVAVSIARNFKRMRGDSATEDRLNGLLTEAGVRRQLVLPLLASAAWLPYWLRSIGEGRTWPTWIVITLLFFALNMLHAFAGGFLSCLACRMRAGAGPWRKRFTRGLAAGLISLAAMVSAIAATAMVQLCHAGAIWFFSHASPLFSLKGAAANTALDWRLDFVLLPPLYLSAPYLGIILLGGFLGADYPEACREWLARFRAWNMLYAGLWILFTGSALVGPYIGAWLVGTAPRLWTAVTAFGIAHGTTLLAGSSSKTDGKRSPLLLLGMKPMDILAWIASPIAIVGLLIAFSSAVEKLGLALQGAVHGGAGIPPFLWAAGIIIFGCLLVQATLGMRIDVNTFSMHAFYRNRLARCYLGATNPDRRPDPFTGFDNNGELADASMATGTVKASRRALYVRNLLPQNWRPLATLDQTERENCKAYQGPFPIFCSTINLTFGQELAWQERKGASFAFTPLYSGYHVGWTAARSSDALSFNGYTATDHYTSDRGVALDTAAAISGAAMNPNQGYNTIPSVAFLMTLFNVRLGWWIWNPRRWQKERIWPLFPWIRITRPSPVCAMSSLGRELLTKVDDTSQFVLLTDGGHFENMGLYELVRRRCKYIVISDAEEDESMQFEGIGRAIRNCRLDFGAEIDLDLRPLQLQKETSMSQMHCVVGTIKYPPPFGPQEQAADDGRYMGKVVYIKSSLTGDEPGDLLSYKNSNAAFPQDSTANQRFTESQFESYRRLGHHVGLTTFQPATISLDYSHDSMASLFENLLQIWYPPTPELQAHFTEHTAHAERLLSELRSEPELQGLAAALFSPCGSANKNWAAKNPAQEDYALQFGNSMIDFMGVVYNNLQLAFRDNHTSPHAQGWIKLFQKWCDTTLVRTAWAKFGDTYPDEFKLFAEHVLNIRP